jgi:hypothetical protein
MTNVRPVYLSQIMICKFENYSSTLNPYMVLGMELVISLILS